MNIGILTSGGDSQGMNSAIRAITRIAIIKGHKVTGIKKGFQGLMDGLFVPLDLRDVGDILHRGGTFLQSERSSDFYFPEGQERAIAHLKEASIDHLVIIGGDGSYRGALALFQKGIKTYCLPGTIDNDISFTDYTIGFDTAVNIVVSLINKIRDTSTSHDRTSVIMVMGKGSGNIALHSGIASGADAILLPEVPWCIEEVCHSIKKGYDRGKRHGIIVVAEGAGCGSTIAKEIEKRTQLETRNTNLGHVQRGGSPSAFDRIFASRMGDKVIECIENGIAGVAVGIEQNEITYHSIKDVLNNKPDFNYKLYEIAKNLSQ
ncbi:6-phosphofructokinase [Anaerobacillus alkalilacustris]|nr:6-phosphofructokinase [Anaerobacillus alkalilacustris]